MEKGQIVFDINKDLDLEFTQFVLSQFFVLLELNELRDRLSNIEC